MTPTEIAVLTNVALDLLVALKKVGIKITPENIDDHIAQAQAQADAIEEKINASNNNSQ